MFFLVAQSGNKGASPLVLLALATPKWSHSDLPNRFRARVSRKSRVIRHIREAGRVRPRPSLSSVYPLLCCAS